MKTTETDWADFRSKAGRKPFLEKPRRISMLLNEKQFIFCKQNNEVISLYIRSLIDHQMQLQNTAHSISLRIPLGETLGEN